MISINKDSCLISNHPMGDEVKRKINSGELVISTPINLTGPVIWDSKTEEDFRIAMNKVSRLRSN